VSRRAVTPLLVLLTLSSPVAAVPARAQARDVGTASPHDVFAILAVIDEAATRQVWPEFRLSDWPIAVFDGSQTLLLRHPSPPTEFAPLPGKPAVLAMPGRHPAVAGNSTTDIGGVRTATVVAAPGHALDGILLAYVEEVFHVFWLRRHANYRPNEMARYAYPVKDAGNLRRVLAEDEALARALEVESADLARAWAATFVGIRKERAAPLGGDERAFETGLEMMEGTANSVARVVVGEKPAATAARLRAPREADQIRWRYYDSGAAICLLLDRLQADWKTRIDAEPDTTALALLEAAVARDAARPAAFSPAELSGFETKAAAAIGDLSARQRSVRDELLGRGGPRLVFEVVAGGEPLHVARFDPINLFVLDGGAVVHPHYLTLSSAAGRVEVTNPAYARGSYGGIVALTAPAGRHPLTDGIRALTVVGLRGMPKVDRREGAVSIETDGIHITLRDADARAEGETLYISLPARR
jgi:hypothetical protein